MRVYIVIPISRGISKSHLTYFGQDNIPLGSLVSIPLRKKIVPALIVEKKDALELKSQLRSSRYPLKKISGIKTRHFLPEKFFESVLSTADFFAYAPGAVLGALVPKMVAENASKIALEGKLVGETGERFLIQAEDSERLVHYKSLIREEFAKKRSVFFCVPTIEDAERTRKILNRGIEQYTLNFHSDVAKREFLKRYEILRDTSHPVLIIGTVPFISLIRPDVGLIILDRENSRSYRTLSRPYIDLRKFVETLASERKDRLIFGDALLSVERLWRKENSEFHELTPIKFRSTTSAECVLIDMKRPPDSEQKTFRVLGDELEELIEFNYRKKQHLFIFSARKGLAPTTVCGDCGKIVTCQTCGSVLVLHSGGGSSSERENFFLCHKCGEKRSSLMKCENCSSWKLEGLGIGIERVEAEVKKRFPSVPVFRIDKETTKTTKRVLETVEKFSITPGSILLGTEMSLLFLDRNIENTAVASLDSLFSLPNFRINEKIFSILLKIRSITQSIFLVQTRNIENHLFDKAISGNTTEFYRQEIFDRKKFNYPPYSLFVKISLLGGRNLVEKQMESIIKIFKGENVLVLDGFTAVAGKRYSSHALMRFKPQEWPRKDIVEKLLSLPPYFKIEVDPESLL